MGGGATRRQILVAPAYCYYIGLGGLVNTARYLEAVVICGFRGATTETLRSFSAYSRNRGMDHDLVDWVGDYPYEGARPDGGFRFFDSRGYLLEGLTSARGLGCNEFLFRPPQRIAPPNGAP